MHSLRALLVAAVTVSLAPGALAATPNRPAPIAAETPRVPDATRWYYSNRPASQAARFGWRRAGIAFEAYLHPRPGTVPVYCETPAYAPHSHYHFSTRPAAEAARFGWKQLFVAWYAYPAKRPGTIPVYMETLTERPHHRYRLSTGHRTPGWTRLYAAFWVPAD